MARKPARCRRGMTSVMTIDYASISIIAHIICNMLDETYCQAYYTTTSKTLNNPPDQKLRDAMRKRINNASGQEKNDGDEEEFPPTKDITERGDHRLRHFATSDQLFVQHFAMYQTDRRMVRDMQNRPRSSEPHSHLLRWRCSRAS